MNTGFSSLTTYLSSQRFFLAMVGILSFVAVFATVALTQQQQDLRQQAQVDPYNVCTASQTYTCINGQQAYCPAIGVPPAITNCPNGCSGGHCNTTSGVGGFCMTHAQCNTGLVCKNGKCEALSATSTPVTNRANGTFCSTNSVCASGYCDTVNLKCADKPGNYCTKNADCATNFLCNAQNRCETVVANPTPRPNTPMSWDPERSGEICGAPAGCICNNGPDTGKRVDPGGICRTSATASQTGSVCSPSARLSCIGITGLRMCNSTGNGYTDITCAPGYECRDAQCQSISSSATSSSEGKILADGQACTGSIFEKCQCGDKTISSGQVCVLSSTTSLPTTNRADGTFCSLNSQCGSSSFCDTKVLQCAPKPDNYCVINSDCKDKSQTCQQNRCQAQATLTTANYIRLQEGQTCYGIAPCICTTGPDTGKNVPPGNACQVTITSNISTQSNPAFLDALANTPLFGPERFLTAANIAANSSGTLFERVLTGLGYYAGINDVVTSSNRLFYQTGLTPAQAEAYRSDPLLRLGDAINVGGFAIGVGDTVANMFGYGYRPVTQTTTNTNTTITQGVDDVTGAPCLIPAVKGISTENDDQQGEVLGCMTYGSLSQSQVDAVNQVLQENNIYPAGIVGSSMADPNLLEEARRIYGYPINQLSPQDIDIIVPSKTPSLVQDALRELENILGVPVQVVPNPDVIGPIQNMARRGSPALIIDNFGNMNYYPAAPNYYAVDELGNIGKGIRKAPQFE